MGILFLLPGHAELFHPLSSHRAICGSSHLNFILTSGHCSLPRENADHTFFTPLSYISLPMECSPRVCKALLASTDKFLKLFPALALHTGIFAISSYRQICDQFLLSHSSLLLICF